MRRQVSRRALLRGMVGVGGAALLAACGGGSQPAASNEAPATSNEAPATSNESPTSAPAVVSETGSTVEITYWGSFSSSSGEAEQAIVDEFNASQSDVKVNYQYQGSYEDTAQKLTAGLQARSVPEVCLLSDVWWFKFYLAEAIAPLNDLAQAEKVNLDDYEPVLLNEGLRNGKYYWIPFARSTPLFYYNRDAWEEAGLPDRGPETWSELQEWSEKLTKKDGDIITRAAFGHPNGASYVAWLFQGVVWQFGGQYSTPEFKITLDDPNVARASMMYHDSVNVDKWAIASQDLNKDFLGGAICSMMASTGSLTGIERDAEFRVGTAFLPKETYFGCPTGGSGMAILSSVPAEKQQAAMKFVAYATSPEKTTFWAKATGYMPVRKSAVTSDEMKAFFDEHPNFKVAVEQLPQTRAQDAARVFIPGGDQIIGKGLERITLGGESPEPVWKEVTAELEKAAAPVLRDLEAIS